MAYHDEILLHARQLVQRERKNPRQVSLRRAISAAYYALFHLLISKAASNWNQSKLRATLSRAFDHGIMKAASSRINDGRKTRFVGEDPTAVANLRFVAKAFVVLQEERHIADYDNATEWEASQATSLVALAEEAFKKWAAIRNEPVAQAYLLSLLIEKRD